MNLDLKTNFNANDLNNLCTNVLEVYGFIGVHTKMCQIVDIVHESDSLPSLRRIEAFDVMATMPQKASPSWPKVEDVPLQQYLGDELSNAIVRSINEIDALSAATRQIWITMEPLFMALVALHHDDITEGLM